ncbi:unnamed protein product [Rhizoctonia solani]|uniref:Uncharacterized protein n=1 Tax=Rhizoctonia solani TaxID=456999 RepID=A0A8H3AFL9_9AGAM|nr:unnamed protein product [Rhizoctonia solani]
MLPLPDHRNSLDSESGRPFLEHVRQMDYEDDMEFAESKLGRPFSMKSLLCHHRTRLTLFWVGLLMAGAGVYLLSGFSVPKWSEMSVPPKTEDEAGPGRFVPLTTTNATATFRENLVPSMKYVTTFISAGFTNQFMEITSLVYLSILTRRAPVVPAFLAEHFGRATDIAPTPFSDIFDLPYLSGKLVDGPHPKIEKIGCWSTTAGSKDSRPSYPYSPEIYGLDISYTPVPSTYTLTHGSNPDTNMWSIWGLASLGFTRSRAQVLPDQFRKAFPLQSNPNQKLEPDETMLCWDNLYYTGIFEPYPSLDFFKDYSPYWSQVGTHMRWKQSLVELATQYLRRHFGIQNTTDPIPPFISVHVRRSDFEGGCSKDVSKEQCFAPVAAYERRVKEVQARLKDRTNGTDVQEILVTSDEQNSAWWVQVSALGSEWRWIDHATEQTSERYGKWFPLLLDAVFQSMGKGFVGTDRSTMSDLARVRVEDWNDGESAMVRWGTPDADNH